MPPSPVGQEHFERADWKKIVFALVDYAYRGLGPDATWGEARVMARTAIALALDPETEEWNPRDETLLKHLGRTLRDIVLLVRAKRGAGREAREQSPDWSLAARTHGNAEMMARIAGPAGLPIAVHELFRAKRRMRAHAMDVLAELRPEKP